LAVTCLSAIFYAVVVEEHVWAYFPGTGTNSTAWNKTVVGGLPLPLIPMAAGCWLARRAQTWARPCTFLLIVSVATWLVLLVFMVLGKALT
jgi:hypothetical protein